MGKTLKNENFEESNSLPIQRKRIYVPTNREHLIAPPLDVGILENLDIENFVIPVPEGKKLFPFQEQAIRAMVRFYKEKSMKAVYNAFDPGTGKSAMSIVLAANVLKCQRILVLCPSGTRGNFEDEIRMWDCDQQPVPVHTLYSSRGALRPITAKWCICSYALLLRRNVFERLYEVPWSMLIMDEAKALKSLRAKQTQLALELFSRRARKAIFMDGTPITRTTLDIFPPCHAILPDQFPSIDLFAEEYCLKRSVPWGYSKFEYFGGKNLEQLRDILRSSFFIRKTKEEVIEDLPDTTYQKIVLDCGPLDKKLSEQQEKNILEAIRMGRDPTECARPEDKKHISERFLEAGLKTVKEGAPFIADFLEAGIPVMLIAYNRVVIDTCMQIFEKYNPVKIDGSVQGAAKDRARNAFNDGTTNLIILQIKSAVGINLQSRCSTAIYIQLSYDPTQIRQSLDRIRRIGQKSAINAYFLVAKSSIDDEVFKILKQKLTMIDQVIVSTDH